MLTAKITSFILGMFFGGGVGMITSAFLFAAHEETVRNGHPEQHKCPESNDNRCVCCGNVIPEGRQICPKCEKGELE